MPRGAFALGEADGGRRAQVLVKVVGGKWTLMQ